MPLGAETGRAGMEKNVRAKLRVQNYGFLPGSGSPFLIGTFRPRAGFAQLNCSLPHCL
jgi:hypothetical protein